MDKGIKSSAISQKGRHLKAGKSIRPLGLTLIINWAIKPFTMYAISIFFLGTLFLTFIGPEAVDYVKMPFGLDLAAGKTYGVGRVVIHEGTKVLEEPLWRSYLYFFVCAPMRNSAFSMEF